MLHHVILVLVQCHLYLNTRGSKRGGWRGEEQLDGTRERHGPRVGRPEDGLVIYGGELLENPELPVGVDRYRNDDALTRGLADISAGEKQKKKK